MSLSGWASVIASNTAPMFRSTERPFALETAPVAVAAVPAAPVEPATAQVEPVASAPSATVTLAEVSSFGCHVCIVCLIKGSCFSNWMHLKLKERHFMLFFSIVIDESLRPLQRVFCITSWFIPAFMYKNAGMNAQTSPEISLSLMSIPPPCSTREPTPQRSRRCHGPAFDQGTGFPPGKSGNANLVTSG